MIRMQKQKMSRRQFLSLSAAATAGIVAAACAPAAPVPVPAAPVETTPATPAGPPSTYNEAPMLAELVAQGQLPPVDDRLPEVPMVVEPTDEIGQYGGTLNTFMLNAEDRSAVFNFVLDYPLIDVPRNVADFVPQLPQGGWEGMHVESYEWNDDATELTLHLRPGLKWSDGEPCTAEDFAWFYNDELFNPDLTPTPPGHLVMNGTPITVSAPDETTLVYSFPEPNPGFLRYVRFEYQLVHRPKHYFSQFHPTYNSSATLEQYREAIDDWLAPERPQTSAWIVESSTPEGVMCVRNPYYFAVDTAGNQLPYADRVWFPMVGTTDNAVLKSIAGEIDVAERNMQQIDQLPLLLENQEAGNYEILRWSGAFFGVGTVLQFNYQLADPEYPELREMLRNRDFRYALTIAVDREDINDALYLGLGRPAMWVLNSTSPYFDDEVAEIVAPIYDPEAAKALLDGLDLVDRDGDGKREYPNGEPVTILVDVSSEIKPHVLSGESIVRYWNEIGLDARLNTISRSLAQDRLQQHINHARVWGPFNADIPEWTTEEAYRPLGLNPSYRVADDSLPEEFAVMDEFHQQIQASLGNYDETLRLYKEMARYRIEQGLDLNTVADLPYLVVAHSRVGNIAREGSGILGVRIENQEQFYLKQ
jgi:peptide/nickel transport system substrate-binding protein